MDVQRIREDFPALHQQVNGKPLVYLDSAATTQKPLSVIQAVRQYYEKDNSNVHRGVHTLSARATESYETARIKVQRFINAADAREIIFVRGATEGINLVANSYGRKHIRAGDELLITAMEHHSNIVPWQLLCEEKDAHLRVAPINERGEVVLESYEKLITDRTKLVAITYISNSLGTINPVKEMIELAHRRRVPVLVDGAQAGPHLPLDVQEIGCDFLVVSGHKMYAPTGIGALYGKLELLESMPPYQGGGEMIQSVTFEKTTYNDVPHKFEAGTPNIADAVGFGAAIDYLNALGMQAIAAHEDDLVRCAIAALSAIPGLRFIGTARDRAAVVSFTIENIHPHDIGTILDQEGIAIRTGHHCSQPVMDRFGVPATSRASFGLYNTHAEIDSLVAGIYKAKELFSLE
ncbi:MAG: SufS family cysteine desulfurase [Candidatus Latescibacteria bacterium]|nr:SufS family cysteine desulfurase [Candidatus Latescibacterota bacterium]NIM21742.1 SufS family cysteine desulfurase [Candidatus Latescibacterota bacterium]NIM65880.1 SufS family cysteine desulfurase [Candidatus Latescibacterota bacterium]NIO02625.1 SufS family cysteine desulfurase [Candidatus Latescibacterota bacterium]NIO29606.1 SufS family cysteine desulfurase [Candidatus Latescibacterota bacterium]